MKFEGAQCLGTARRISVRQQQIEPEPYQGASPIRLHVDHGAVKIIGENPPGFAQTERALRQPERLLPLRCIAQFVP
jgi:hypothetical protein